MNPIENPPTRAPYGGGSITALPNGHFRVRVRLALELAEAVLVSIDASTALTG